MTTFQNPEFYSFRYKSEEYCHCWRFRNTLPHALAFICLDNKWMCYTYIPNNEDGQVGLCLKNTSKDENIVRNVDVTCGFLTKLDTKLVVSNTQRDIDGSRFIQHNIILRSELNYYMKEYEALYLFVAIKKKFPFGRLEGKGTLLTLMLQKQ